MADGAVETATFASANTPRAEASAEAAPSTVARPTPVFLADGVGQVWQQRPSTVRPVITMMGVAQFFVHGGAARHRS
eukprot:2201039-Lingulodinium_polyedra.AAC.1